MLLGGLPAARGALRAAPAAEPAQRLLGAARAAGAPEPLGMGVTTSYDSQKARLI